MPEIEHYLIVSISLNNFLISLGFKVENIIVDKTYQALQ